MFGSLLKSSKESHDSFIPSNGKDTKNDTVREGLIYSVKSIVLFVD